MAQRLDFISTQSQKGFFCIELSLRCHVVALYLGSSYFDERGLIAKQIWRMATAASLVSKEWSSWALPRLQQLSTYGYITCLFQLDVHSQVTTPNAVLGALFPSPPYLSST